MKLFVSKRKNHGGVQFTVSAIVEGDLVTFYLLQHRVRVPRKSFLERFESVGRTHPDERN